MARGKAVLAGAALFGLLAVGAVVWLLSGESLVPSPEAPSGTQAASPDPRATPPQGPNRPPPSSRSRRLSPPEEGRSSAGSCADPRPSPCRARSPCPAAPWPAAP